MSKISGRACILVFFASYDSLHAKICLFGVNVDVGSCCHFFTKKQTNNNKQKNFCSYFASPMAGRWLKVSETSHHRFSSQMAAATQASGLDVWLWLAKKTRVCELKRKEQTTKSTTTQNNLERRACRGISRRFFWNQGASVLLHGVFVDPCFCVVEVSVERKRVRGSVE